MTDIEISSDFIACKEYVLGFAYTLDDRVLLIEKNRPDWQKGLLNGIGGKVELWEKPEDAMRREAMEESGLDLGWYYKGIMAGINNDYSLFKVHIFYARSNKVTQFRQMEDERLGLYTLAEILQLPRVANLNYLVPVGLCNSGLKFMTLEYEPPRRTL